GPCIEAPAHPSRTAMRVKRGIDLVLSAIAVVVLSPLMLALAIVVRVTSAGPGLFRQRRVGVNGDLFTMFKFRTMYVDCDEAPHREYVTDLLRGVERDAARTGHY